MSGGGGGGSDTQKTESEPWAPQQEYLRYLFDQARSQYQSAGQQEIPGLTEEQQRAAQAREAMGEQYASGQSPVHQQGQVAGDYLSQAPGVLQEQMDPTITEEQRRAAYEPVQREMEEEILPSIRAGAIEAGQPGGGRQAIAEGIAARDAQDSMAQQEAQLQNAAQQRALQASQQQASLLPQLASQRTQLGQQEAQAEQSGAQMLEAAGAPERQLQMARAQEAYQAPQRNLQQYAQLVGGNYGGVQEQPAPQGPSTGQKALSGAATGAGIGTQINPGMGTAVGAGVGALGGAFL